MKRKSTSLAQAALFYAITTSAAMASFTISGQIGALLDSGGNPVAAGRIAALVADFSNDGLLNLGNTTLSTNSFIGGGTDDQILRIGYTSDLGGGLIGFDFGGDPFTFSGDFNVGDHLYVVWLPSITATGITLDEGISYGYYRSDSIDLNSGANSAWMAPADSSAVDMSAFDNVTAPGALASPTDFTASFTTSAVPEPATYAALFGLASIGFCVWRKRRKA